MTATTTSTMTAHLGQTSRPARDGGTEAQRQRVADWKAAHALGRTERAMGDVLTVPCATHAAGPHEPCWELPARGRARAVCGARVARAGYAPRG